jgi:hypothetical protein
MCERLKQAVLKTALPERVTGVRIPLPPPYSLQKQLLFYANRKSNQDAAFRIDPDPKRDWRIGSKSATAPIKPILSDDLQRGPFRAAKSLNLSQIGTPANRGRYPDSLPIKKFQRGRLSHVADHVSVGMHAMHQVATQSGIRDGRYKVGFYPSWSTASYTDTAQDRFRRSPTGCKGPNTRTPHLQRRVFRIALATLRFSPGRRLEANRSSPQSAGGYSEPSQPTRQQTTSTNSQLR